MTEGIGAPTAREVGAERLRAGRPLLFSLPMAATLNSVWVVCHVPNECVYLAMWRLHVFFSQLLEVKQPRASAAQS